MTRKEALAFKSRWRLANERIAEETRNTSSLTKLRQLANMFVRGNSSDWSEAVRHSEEVWDRWQQIRERLNDQSQSF